MTSAAVQQDLIAAVATPPGQGGIGIVRLSGPGAADLAARLCGRQLDPRQAHYVPFQDTDDVIIDRGLALFFPGPASFTGEDVVELHGHGSPVVMAQLQRRVCALGARLARPGEFSERAFLHGKLDLAQAEAVADLIASTSAAAARAATASLQGVFSRRVHTLVDTLTRQRLLLEAALDFPDEEVDVVNEAGINIALADMATQLQALLADAQSGQRLADGATLILLGAPNVGKSSLLNVLSGEETAIVTDIPGTTRDLLKVDLVLDGLPVRIIDTAGIRATLDDVERIGVARAQAQARSADVIVLLLDAQGLVAGRSDWQQEADELLADLTLSDQQQVLCVVNKIDLVDATAVPTVHSRWGALVPISVKDDVGMAPLKTRLIESLGVPGDAPFTARARHVEALQQADEHLQAATQQLQQLLAGTSAIGVEFVAEEMRLAQDRLGEITGTVTPDDLLGKIFSEFCIGK
ncbi:MAG: tRNA uridine-5-carboxymethylaminomethyl(34) synthesis GTPase MnmE [Pseudomonadota bacterium]